MIELEFNGKKYISLKRASGISGYAKDYIGQLCRGEKLKCKQVGNNWFVEFDDLALYQKQKYQNLNNKNNTISAKQDYGFKKNIAPLGYSILIVLLIFGTFKYFNKVEAAYAEWLHPAFAGAAEVLIKISEIKFPEKEIIGAGWKIAKEYLSAINGTGDFVASFSASASNKTLALAKAAAEINLPELPKLNFKYFKYKNISDNFALMMGSAKNILGDAGQKMEEIVTDIKEGFVATFQNIIPQQQKQTEISKEQTEILKEKEIDNLKKESEQASEQIKKSELSIEGPAERKKTIVEKTVVRTVEKIISGLTNEDLDSKLQELNTKLMAEILATKNLAISRSSSNAQMITLTQRIDNLSGVTLNNTTFTGTVSGLSLTGDYLSLSGGTLTGALTGTSFSFTSTTATSTLAGGLQTDSFRVNSTTATSTFANGLRIETGGLTLDQLVNCDTIDTDASGNFICGSDATGAGGGASFGQAWEIDAGGFLAPTTTLSIFVSDTSATSTIYNLNTDKLLSGTYIEAPYFTATSTTASSTFPYLASTQSDVGTVVGGTWQGAPIGDAYLTKSGDWTGTFDSQEGSYYLDASNLANFGKPFYTFFSATNTDALTEGSTNKYYADSLARAAFSSTATGLTYTSGTGVFSLTSGYEIPTTVSAASWNNKWDLASTTIGVAYGGTGATSFTDKRLIAYDGSTLISTSTIYSDSISDVYLFNNADDTTTGQLTAANFVASSGSATSTFAGGLQTDSFRVNSTTATSTFANGLRIETGGLTLDQLVNCDTIDTDASGNFICGSDATGAGGGASFGQAWEIDAGGLLAPTTTLSILANSNLFVTGDTDIYGGDINLGTGTATSTLTSSGGFLGVGTTTPYAFLSAEATAGGDTPLFSVASSTNGAATSTALFISSNGLVGIGMTNPANALDVTGAITLTGVLSMKDDMQLRIGTSNDSMFEWDTNQTNDSLLLGVYGGGSGQGGSLIMIDGADTATNFMHQINSDPTLYIQSSDQTQVNDYISFWHNQTDANIAWGNGNLNIGNMSATSTFTSTGDFGLGSTTPAAKIGIEAISLGATPLFMMSTSTNLATTTSFIIDSNGLLGIGSSTPYAELSVVGKFAIDGLESIGVNGNPLCLVGKDVQVGTGVDCTASSQRYKYDIEEQQSVLSLVNSLHPVSFKFKANDELHLGFIAEEVYSIEPRLVDLDKEGLPAGVRYVELTSVLTKAIQEMNLEISNLKSQISNQNETNSNDGNIFGSLLSWLEDKIVKAKEFIADKITTKKVITDELEMKDSATGEIYCARITNGEWEKIKGECEAGSQPEPEPEPEPQPEPQPEPEIPVEQPQSQ